MLFPKLLVSLALSLVLASNLSAQSPSVDKPNLITRTLREALDTAVSPCDDFDRFANGGWKTKYKNLHFGLAHQLSHRTADRLLEVLEAARKAAPTTTDPTIKALGTYYASCLAVDTIEARFSQTSAEGAPKSRPEQCLTSSARRMPVALSYAFISWIIPPTQTAATQAWLATIQNAIRAEVMQFTWIEDSVRKNLLTTLDKMHFSINLVPPPIDYSGLTLSPTDYYGNVKQVPGFEKKMAANLPKDSMLSKSKHGPLSPFSDMLPYRFHVSSAAAIPKHNLLVVTPVWFQPPLFDVNAEPAANYAGLGAIFGHEMWHLLSPVMQWKSTEEGRRRAAKVADSYSQIDKKSGWQTFEEDLGDLGGLLATYHAWTQHGRKHEKPLIEGFTPEQRFFLYYARLWRDSGPGYPPHNHSDPWTRINGVVMQMPAFGKAFGCKEGDPMFLPADRRTDAFQ